MIGYKITTETREYTPFDTMRTEIVTRKATNVEKAINAIKRSEAHSDSKRTHTSISQIVINKPVQPLKLVSDYTKTWWEDINQ